MTVTVGTSGWQYDDWRGVLYPERLAKARWLEHFASRFPAVEVNNTFYRLPSEDTFASWRERTPDGFTFAVKASRYITHIRKLADVGPAVTELVERASRLGPKLGPILYQLPPSLKRDDALLASFLDALPPYPRATMEFRSSTWHDDDVLAALSARDVALCITGLDRPAANASWAYLRLHGGPDYSRYTEAELDAVVARVVAAHEGGADPIYAFFDNDVQGNAVRDADALTARLGAAGVPVSAAAPPEDGGLLGSGEKA